MSRNGECFGVVKNEDEGHKRDEQNPIRAVSRSSPILLLWERWNRLISSSITIASMFAARGTTLEICSSLLTPYR